MEDNSMETLILDGKVRREPIVLVRNAYKRYAPNVVILQALDMTVPKGSIYSLLGPSGCGKTTLLNCIIGRKTLDYGQIKLNLETKDQLGYMPQEVSLYEGLIMSEVFMYFGMMMNKSTEYILARQKELIELLDLPPASRTVESLSGGQQRRVSMAVAFIHDPELLVLDEPTVGVDPLLCYNIWQYFLKITSEERKTIIITTHYIEEARHSHTIGLLRGGVLLAEMSPLALMVSLNCSTLEEAFLTLSEKQEASGPDTSEYPVSESPPEAPLKSDDIFQSYRFNAQLVKNMLFIKRNIPMTLFMLLLPAALFIIVIFMLSGDLEDLPLAVVRDELTSGVDDCNKTHTISSPYGCTIDTRLSCDFVEFLIINKSYAVTDYSNLEEGKDAVRQSKAWALLHFPKNYTENLLDRLDRGRKSLNTTLEDSAIQVYPDNSVFYISVVLMRNLIGGYISFMETFSKNCNIHPKVFRVPMREEEPVYKGYESFQYDPLNGYIITILFYLAYVFTSSAMVYERRNGLLERSLISGLTTLEMTSAHVCTQSLLTVLQISILYFILFVMFDVVPSTGIGLVTILFFLTEYSGMAIGYLFVEHVADERLVTYSGITLIVMLFFSVGMMWPIEGMHWLVRGFGEYSPVTKAVISYRSILFRDLPFTHPLIYEGYLYLSVLLVVSTVIWYFKMKKNSSQ